VKTSKLKPKMACSNQYECLVNINGEILVRNTMRLFSPG